MNAWELSKTSQSFCEYKACYKHKSILCLISKQDATEDAFKTFRAEHCGDDGI